MNSGSTLSSLNIGTTMLSTGGLGRRARSGYRSGTVGSCAAAGRGIRPAGVNRDERDAPTASPRMRRGAHVDCQVRNAMATPEARDAGHLRAGPVSH